MELPQIGAHCQWLECKCLDFLPFTCSFCSGIFCQHHFQAGSHQCHHVFISKSSDDIATPKNFKCSMPECNKSDVVKMLCVKCHFHFCLAHRYHNCFEYSEEEIASARRKLSLPREQFSKSLQKVSVLINQNLEKNKEIAKNRATALKIQLMRLKGKAKGELSIPAAERVYFLVFPPYKFKMNSKAVYVSKYWTIGRVIDAVSSLCDTPNKNNVSNASKLRLFKKNGGLQVSTNMSEKISDLLETGEIENGESLILDYVNPEDSLLDFVIKSPGDYLE